MMTLQKGKKSSIVAYEVIFLMEYELTLLQSLVVGILERSIFYLLRGQLGIVLLNDAMIGN